MSKAEKVTQDKGRNVNVHSETERMRLRHFTEGDIDNLFELHNDAEVMLYINGGLPTPRNFVGDRVLPRYFRESEQMEGYGHWAAERLDTRDFLGWFGLMPRAGSRREAEIGYRLRRSIWGQGYATEGARHLIDFAFTELDTQAVFATTYGENAASRRVMEKAGLMFLRSFRMTADELSLGHPHQVSGEELWDGDDVEYVLSRRDWESARNRKRS